jgi:hypothetical protein
MKIGDKFTHIHFDRPQNVTITEEENRTFFCSNDGYNGGSWEYPHKIEELNKRYEDWIIEHTEKL